MSMVYRRAEKIQELQDTNVIKVKNYPFLSLTSPLYTTRNYSSIASINNPTSKSAKRSYTRLYFDGSKPFNIYCLVHNMVNPTMSYVINVG